MSTPGEFFPDNNTYAQTGEEVYLSVCKEFKIWKTLYEKEILASLPKPSEKPASFSLPPGIFKPAELPPDLADRPEGYIIIEDFDDDGNVVNTEYVRVETVKPIKVEPHPPYHYCTPAVRNRLPTAQDTRSAPFIPYPEDKTFCNLYLDCPSFENVQWRVDYRDPDAEVVEYETVRRLHTEHGFPFEVIAEIMYNYRPLRVSNESGLLWDVSQRDFLPVIWGDGLPSSSKPQLPTDFGVNLAHPNDILTEVNLGLAKFCSNLNCLIHNCHVHIDPEWHRINPAYIPKQPHLTCKALYGKKGGSCGKDCFRHLDSGIMEIDDVPYDFTFLDSLFKIRPDELPCVLAPICRLPCKQIYLRRCQKIPDYKVSPPNPEPYTAQDLNFAGTELPQLHPLCPPRPVLGGEQLRRKRPTPRCQNMDIQRGQFKKFDIRKGKYGLGAFAAQNIKAGDALGEYVGELVDGEFGPHEMLQKKSGLNYAFGLTGSKDTVDSHWYGNATRFLNDSTYGPNPKPPNCVAAEHIVNGERRIVLKAGKFLIVAPFR
ncbi:hypothetical protein C8R43DRAFT_1155099 [Mycena crocata]|nr:hypothetical protein C8R43DRAFT_1155099 [Mycena crocata]